MPFRTVLAVFIINVTAVAIVAADSPAAADRTVRATLVFDTSPPNKNVDSELRAVAEAVVRSLRPGDAFTILSAHADRPRLRALTTVASREVTDLALTQALAEIRPALILDADLAAALDVVIPSLHRSPTEASRVLVIVLTDGTMSDNAADRFLAKVHEIESLGARVFCTGLEQANRRLLVAGAQGRLRWVRIPDCNPATWVTDLRAALSVPTPPAPAAAPAGRPGDIPLVPSPLTASSPQGTLPREAADRTTRDPYLPPAMLMSRLPLRLQHHPSLRDVPMPRKLAQAHRGHSFSPYPATLSSSGR